MPEKNRNSNIELLRIFSMLMIVAYHAATNSILYDNNILGLGSIQNKLTISFLYPCGRIGVMLFFMITGYFLSEKRARNCTSLIIKTCFYSIITTIAYIMMKYLARIPIQNYGGGRTLLLSFLPISSGVIWFTTSYVFLVFLLPILNPLLKRLTLKGFVFFLIFLDFVPFGIGSIFDVPYSRMYEALFFYSIGVFYKRFFVNKQKALFSLIICLIAYCFSVGFSYFYIRMKLDNSKITFVIPFIIKTVFVPTIGFGLFTIFTSKSLGNRKLINLIAGSTLTVYLLHGSIFQKAIWEQVFHVKELYMKSYFPIGIIGMTVAVYLCSVLIDLFCNKFIFPYLNNLVNFFINKFKMYCIEVDS